MGAGGEDEDGEEEEEQDRGGEDEGVFSLLEQVLHCGYCHPRSRSRSEDVTREIRERSERGSGQTYGQPW